MKKSEAEFRRLCKDCKRGALVFFCAYCMVLGFLNIAYDVLHGANELYHEVKLAIENRK